MTFNPNPKKAFIPQFLPEALRTAYEFANTPSKIPSKTIRQWMYYDNKPGLSGRVRVPIYWAGWYHDGRNGIRLTEGFMVFYKDPKDDPRIAGGTKYPFTKAQVKSLRDFPGRFKADLKAGKLIVTRSVGPTAWTPYFNDNSSRGMLGLQDRLDFAAAKSLDAYVEEKLRSKGLLRRKVKVTI